MPFSQYAGSTTTRRLQSSVNVTRRDYLRTLGSLASIAWFHPIRLWAQENDEPVRIPGKKPLLLRNDYPEDLETPLEDFNTWITPNETFFVRQHLPRPQAQTNSWRLVVNGKVSKTLSLSLTELQKLPHVTLPATLECAGNGRGLFEPRVPGVPWNLGAIGNAQWTGVRLSEILRLAGYDKAAQYVEFDGADSGPGNTPDFVRSLPIAKANHPATLVAFQMNGERLPDIHGYPARLIVPGWDGAWWVKWVTRITVQDQAGEGFFMKTAYRFPRYPVIPGSSAKPEDLETIEGMPVKSVITYPQNQQRLPLEELKIRGYAWAGEERIKSIEVSTDAGSLWSQAQIVSPNQNFAWVFWEATWKPTEPGYVTVFSRATDILGRAQPINATWNPSGYLWNQIDRIHVLFEKS